MGANTYIGNGPNFMVRSIAERRGALKEAERLAPAPLGQPHPLVEAGIRAEEQSQWPDQQKKGEECDCHTLSIGSLFDKHKSSYHSC